MNTVTTYFHRLLIGQNLNVCGTAAERLVTFHVPGSKLWCGQAPHPQLIHLLFQTVTQAGSASHSSISSCDDEVWIAPAASAAEIRVIASPCVGDLYQTIFPLR